MAVQTPSTRISYGTYFNLGSERSVRCFEASPSLLRKSLSRQRALRMQWRCRLPRHEPQTDPWWLLLDGTVSLYNLSRTCYVSVNVASAFTSHLARLSSTNGCTAGRNQGAILCLPISRKAKLGSVSFPSTGGSRMFQATRFNLQGCGIYTASQGMRGIMSRCN